MTFALAEELEMRPLQAHCHRPPLTLQSTRAMAHTHHP